MLISWQCLVFPLQLNTEWAQVEVIDLINDGSGLAFGIIGGRSTGVVVKTILPGGVADRVSKLSINIYDSLRNASDGYDLLRIEEAISYNIIIINTSFI